MVVGRVVGEDGRAVEGAVIFGEVEPAFVANTLRALATDADADDVGGGVEERLGEVDQFLVPHFLDARVDGNGRDELVVGDGLSIVERVLLRLAVDRLDRPVGTEASFFFREGFGDGNPDPTCAIERWETESSVGAPVAGGLLQDDILGHGLEIWIGYTLAKPCALHLFPNKLDLIECGPSAYLGCWDSPHFEVVGPHEDVRDACTHCTHDMLVKGPGLRVGDSALERRIDQAVHASDLFFLWQHGDVVLERVRDPIVLASHV